MNYTYCNLDGVGDRMYRDKLVQQVTPTPHSIIINRGVRMESAQDRIARRAYDLFVARGGQHGYHIQDWLKAEKETLAESAMTAPKKKKTSAKKAPAKKVAKTVAKSQAAPVAKKKAVTKKK